jgi:hypothetical protein
MKIYHQNDSTVRRNLGISTTWRPSYLTLWQSGLSLLETRVMGSKLLPPSLLNISGTRDVLGALTFAPRQLLALLRILRTGVPDAQDVHNVAQALNGIPGCAWEQFDGPAVPPAVQGPRMVRITRATSNRTSRPGNGRTRNTMDRRGIPHFPEDSSVNGLQEGFQYRHRPIIRSGITVSNSSSSQLESGTKL